MYKSRKFQGAFKFAGYKSTVLMVVYFGIITVLFFKRVILLYAVKFEAL